MMAHIDDTANDRLTSNARIRSGGTILDDRLQLALALKGSQTVPGRVDQIEDVEIALVQNSNVARVGNMLEII